MQDKWVYDHCAGALDGDMVYNNSLYVYNETILVYYYGMLVGYAIFIIIKKIIIFYVTKDTKFALWYEFLK